MKNFKNSRRSFLARTSIAVVGAAVRPFKPVISFAQSLGKKVTGNSDIRSKIDPDFATMYDK